MGPIKTKQGSRGGRGRGGGGRSGGGRSGKDGSSKTTDLPKALLEELEEGSKARKGQRPVNTITDRKALRKQMRQAKRHGGSRTQANGAYKSHVANEGAKVPAKKALPPASKSASKRADREAPSMSKTKLKEKHSNNDEKKAFKRKKDDDEDVEDQDLRRLEKKLKIKQPGKLGAGFVDDGLDAGGHQKGVISRPGFIHTC
ncbi:hypothetical protein BJ684DRAFT_22007 [Piptocephalis cylindrospora]|uniref:Uncharacterized protein n=1 Tax=Piptocephalis cylindrospora TaxID=1907219 RepID=A0A4P9XYC8_9FUNG|nr:hypothetical protein BJ684DRAFT_22007 [Piptocephalis cylindrospora]|eukprot:RKP11426.1 hypothetical protein BJ684DRAFT_22007 [Piptocephalis cylindrospora]